jgi:hypothetical protein
MQKWLIYSLGFGLLTACSSDELGPKDLADNSLKSEASFCKEWAKAACNDDVVTNCDEVDTSTCVEHQSSFCEDLVPTGYSSNRAEECINAVRDAYEDAVLDADELEVVLNLGGDCSHLVSGGYREGENCTEHNDCDTVHDYTCVIKPGDETGTCQVPNLRGPAKSCSAAEDICEEGTYCDSGNHCVEPDSTGAECTYDAMCPQDDHCAIPSGSTDGIGECTPKLENKATCATDGECQSGICLETTGKCTSNIVLTGESSLCVTL